jgi:hypothetical protein
MTNSVTIPRGLEIRSRITARAAQPELSVSPAWAELWHWQFQRRLVALSVLRNLRTKPIKN